MVATVAMVAMVAATEMIGYRISLLVAVFLASRGRKSQRKVN